MDEKFKDPLHKSFTTCKANNQSLLFFNRLPSVEEFQFEKNNDVNFADNNGFDSVREISNSLQPKLKVSQPGDAYERGRVYDAFAGSEGMTIDAYKKLWEYADAIRFGF